MPALAAENYLKHIPDSVYVMVDSMYEQMARPAVDGAPGEDAS
jgi:hypothetical protein